MTIISKSLFISLTHPNGHWTAPYAHPTQESWKGRTSKVDAWSVFIGEIWWSNKKNAAKRDTPALRTDVILGLKKS